MAYMIHGYGSYDVPEDNIIGIETEEKAHELFVQRAKKWCKRHHVDISEGMSITETYFEYGEEEEGVCIFVILEVPSNENAIEQYLWNAKLELKNADYAAADYAYTLEDNKVGYHTAMAEDNIEKARELIKQML